MKKLFLQTLLILLFTACSTNPSNMKLTSTAFLEGENIPTQFTCDGPDQVPPLSVSEIPAEAKSLVLIADDPDAIAVAWVHWIMWNIPPTTTEITAGSGIEGTNTFGNTGYGGPCPPSGTTHHYDFKIYALDTMLDLPTSATISELAAAMKGHVIDQGRLMGKYQRPS